MVDMDKVIANNIVISLKNQNKKQTELAEALGTNKQTIYKMLNGTRMITASELVNISRFLGLKMEELTIVPNTTEIDNIHVLMGKVNSKEAEDAIQIADMLSEMILFHKRIKENGKMMSEEWD